MDCLLTNAENFLKMSTQISFDKKIFNQQTFFINVLLLLFTQCLPDLEVNLSCSRLTPIILRDLDLCL